MDFTKSCIGFTRASWYCFVFYHKRGWSLAKENFSTVDSRRKFLEEKMLLSIWNVVRRKRFCRWSEKCGKIVDGKLFAQLFGSQSKKCLVSGMAGPTALFKSPCNLESNLGQTTTNLGWTRVWLDFSSFDLKIRKSNLKVCAEVCEPNHTNLLWSQTSLFLGVGPTVGGPRSNQGFVLGLAKFDGFPEVGP